MVWPVKLVIKDLQNVCVINYCLIHLKILEAGKCWDRDPAEGTLRTGIISQHESPPPPQPDPVWIDEVEWIYENCPDSSVYAAFKKITFMDGNRVRLKKRLFSKVQELRWPVVTFLFKSPKMKLIRERLDRDSSVLASIFLNGIPVRKSVDVLSKYAKFRRWYFSDEERKGSTPSKQISCSEIVQYGESIRTRTELKKIDDLKAKDEERKKNLIEMDGPNDV